MFMIVETEFWLITNVYKERFQYFGFISTYNHMDKIKNGQLIQLYTKANKAYMYKLVMI